MGLFSKLGKMGINLLSTKGVRKVGGNSNVIKTTSQTIGSMIPAIAGGKAVRKTVAKVASKGAGGVAKVGKKIAIGTGLIGASVVGGAKVYDYVQDVRSKTPEQRQAEDAFDLWEDINGSNGGSGSGSGGSGKGGSDYDENNPSGVADDNGSNFFSFYDDIKNGETAEAGSTGMSWGLILGAGAVVGGLWYANKKGMFKKGK